MKRDPRTIMLTFGRSLKLKCPVCGRASIVQRPFNLKHRCDSCGTIFKREEGFFVGAIMANVVATEVFILIAYFALLLLTTLSDRATFIILFALAIAFPLTFYHHSWSLWLAMDHLIEGLPPGNRQH
ncbi:MAG: hypothetical protein DMF73_18785 [Acidobacteria bacterium]|nr:MAG: hypothetical protein DMF73_18785 [Acidobacteriota bacterium]